MPGLVLDAANALSSFVLCDVDTFFFIIFFLAIALSAVCFFLDGTVCSLFRAVVQCENNWRPYHNLSSIIINIFQTRALHNHRCVPVPQTQVARENTYCTRLEESNKAS